MLKRLAIAAGLAGALLATSSAGGMFATPAQAKTNVHLYFGVNMGPAWPGFYYYPAPVFYYGPVYVPVYRYRYHRVRYRPRWRWRCRVRVKRVRYWSRRHGHWHYRKVRRRVCHRVRW